MSELWVEGDWVFIFVILNVTDEAWLCVFIRKLTVDLNPEALEGMERKGSLGMALDSRPSQPYVMLKSFLPLGAPCVPLFFLFIVLPISQRDQSEHP